MEHLCYAFIKHFRALDQIEINLDSRYRCHYDPESKVLTITKNRELPKDFWGKRVYSLAAIVGDNGSGKSSILSFLLNDLTEGATGNDEKGIFVYEERNHLYYSGDVNSVVSNISFPIQRGSLITLPSFYYSSHFMPYVTTSDLRCYQLSGSYNASDSWLLIKDFESYTNIDSLRYNNSIGEHLKSHISQNNYRICKMLADRTIRESFVGFKLPRYVIIGPNTSGWQVIHKRRDVLLAENGFRLPASMIASAEDRLLIQWIYYNLLNLYTDGIREKDHHILDLITAWCSLAESISEKPIECFRNLVESNRYVSSDAIDDVLSIADVLTEVTRYTYFSTDSYGSPWFYVDLEDGSNHIDELAEMITSNRLIVSRYFDFSYTQVIDGTECILSSGEQELLNLFSRLYDAIVVSPQRYGSMVPRLIMLDEAEVGFHPDWQRQYISLLLQFLTSLPKNGYKYQIVLTTHSPILLSDIPSSCVNYLKVVNGKSVNYDLSGKETFATNIFNLYRDSFWLEGGMLGEHAYGRIKSISRRLKSGKVDDIEKVITEINMIGDARIKDYLMSLVSNNHSLEAIEYYKARISEIEKAQKNNQS